MTVAEEIRTNPFFVLGMTPQDTRPALIARQAELALFDDDRSADEALARLLHPSGRLRAEIRWFPQTPAGALEPVRALLKSGGAGAVPRLDSPSVLAQFNFLRLAFSLNPPSEERECRAAINALAIMADALYPGQVTEEINGDRSEGGHALLNGTGETEAELRLLLGDAAALCASWVGRSFRVRLGSELEWDYKNRGTDYHNSFLIELTAGCLARG